MYKTEGIPTKAELAAYQDILRSWHSREHFHSYVGMLGRRIPTENLWENPYKFVREAMTLNTYADLNSEVMALRLGNDPPDGWLRLSSGVEIPVELTEALEPGRKRNDEYKGRAAPEAVEYDPKTRIQTIEKQLDNAIKKQGREVFAETCAYRLSKHGRIQSSEARSRSCYRPPKGKLPEQVQWAPRPLARASLLGSSQHHRSAARLPEYRRQC
jgi:hypothetical protein